VVGAWEKSGVTQRAFCEAEGISLAAFGWWRGRFRREERESRFGDEESRGNGENGVSSPLFLPVQIQSGLWDRAGEGVIEVVLRNGRCLRVPRDMDGDALADLAEALESGC